MKKVKVSLKIMRAIMCINPGGNTKLLQTLDVSFNEPFQSDVSRFVWGMIKKGEFEYTNGRNVTPPNYILQVKLIDDPLKIIDSEIMNKTFETCSITKSEVPKINGFKESGMTEETTVLLGESDKNLKLIATATLDFDLTYKIMEEDAKGILS